MGSKMEMNTEFEKCKFNRRVLWVWVWVVGLLLAVQTHCSGQSNQNVVKRVFNAASGTQNSGYLPNSGYGQHYFRATVAEDGGTCNTSSTFVLQASTDGVVFFPISTTVQLLYVSPLRREGSAFANGVYPFLRVAVTSNLAFCKYTVWYIGSLSPISNPQATLNAPNYVTEQFSINNGGGAGYVLNSLLGAVTSARYVIYGATLTNTHATNFADVNIVSCTMPSTIEATGPNLRAQANTNSIIAPAAITPIFIGTVGNSLCAQTGNATGGTTAVLSLTYRLE